MDSASLAHDIKTRVTLSSVVKDVVKLKGRSPNFMGLCPFHQEKTPSFHVRDQVGRFKCFGCGVSGDVFEFIMRLRGISFTEAVAELAHIAGLDVNRPTAPVKKPLANQHDLLSVQKLAQQFFVAELADPKNGLLARQYLQQERGLDDKMIRQAGLGFGSFAKDRFFAFLRQQRITKRSALDSGLVKEGRFLFAPQFLSRITIPIRDLDGRIIAFGGRSFLSSSDEAPKYVNTHSYEHYEKRRNFYGLFESRQAILKGTAPFLVEGYFDAMAFWALGLPALALCGTALSPEHVAILKRLTKRVNICFDSDAAGLLALARSLTELYKKNITPHLIVLDKKDPGSYLADGSMEALKKIAASPTDALCFLIDRAAVLAKKNVVDRMVQIDALLPIFTSIKRPLLRRQYVAYLATSLHEDPALLWADIEKRTRSKHEPIEMVNEKTPPTLTLSSHERLLMQIVLSNPALIVSMPDIKPSLSEHARYIIEMMAEIMAKAPQNDHVELIKAAVFPSYKDLWPSIEEVLVNRVPLSPEAAEGALLAFKHKKDREQTRETLKKKRLELQQFEKVGDYLSVLKTLKEQSLILMSQKPKLVDEKKDSITQSEDVPKAIKQRVAKRTFGGKGQQFGNLEEETFFDTEEDWL